MNTTDATFKKTEQTVGRPETTGLDYQDDLIKNPPNNVQDAPYADKDGREHDIQNKGYSIHPTKEEAEEMDKIRQRLHNEH